MIRFLDRNLLALSENSEALARRIAEAAPDPACSIEQARTGHPVPVFERNGERRRLHSGFDPVKEAERTAETSTARGFIVFFGLGAGYHVSAFLKGDRCAAAVVVEYGLAGVRSIFERIDLASVLADPRVHLLVDPTEAELADAVKGRYIPALHGDFSAVSHRPCVDLAQTEFERAAETARTAVSHVSADYSVQAFFGKRWFLNIVRNLPEAGRPAKPLPPVREAVITAAGPTLEDALDGLVSRGSDVFLIATDTSWPVLAARGIAPDAVVSIDCQHIGYYHFFRKLPESIPLVLDLASPHILATRAPDVRFFSSGHPLCRYIADRWRPFPMLDTSGGNVTHAALSLAETLGAERVRVYGADFSYPRGKSYARGTYIYGYFDRRSRRLSPLESQFQDFMLRSGGLRRVETTDGEFRYETDTLSRYRAAFERFTGDPGSGSTETGEPDQGSGIAFVQAEDDRASGPRAATFRRRGARELRLFVAGRSAGDARSFLMDYRRRLASLPAPTGHPAAYQRALSADERDILMTILPAASAVKRASGAGITTWSELIAETLRWSIGVLDGSLAEN